MSSNCDIRTFFHCRHCLASKPDNESPATWARLEVGITAESAIQVWCVRHDIEVITISLEMLPSFMENVMGRCDGPH